MNIDDWKKLYLNGTKDLCLVFGGDEDGEIIVTASIDANFGIHVDGKSHIGYVASIAGGCVEAKLKKKMLVTIKSIEEHWLHYRVALVFDKWCNMLGIHYLFDYTS